MKIILMALVFCAALCASVMAQATSVNIIPRPQTVTPGSGSFTLTAKTKIVATDDAGRRDAAVLAEMLQRTYGLKLAVTNKLQPTNAIIFTTAVPSTDAAPNPEKYLLKIKPEFISISGGERGMFYGIQTLMQLLPLEITKQAQVSAVDISDQPRFGYRGMHLDVGRNFQPVEFVKRYIDLMGQYKLNYFHWHLTEDQGWRIEIKKYPKLTEIGSKRAETVAGRNLEPYVGDGKPVGGFYTQDQIRDVVAYAKARYITVIPEIEIPGHSSAALAAYPEFGCKQDYNYKVQTTWGIFKEVYCPTEKTFQFLEDVITEVVDLFPDSPYIHIGGDEVLKEMWKDSPEVQALMARENLKDLNEVQSYFTHRMEKFINSKGKKIIGWDEILEGGVAPNAVVMSWRGVKGGIEAAKAKHEVIMTPTTYVYLDYGQGDPAYEPLNIGGYLPLEKVYSFDPVPKDFTAEEGKYILGGQANLWSEYLQTPESIEYMVFPRMLALAEDVWTDPKNKNFADFQKRLSSELLRLDKQKVNYRIPEPAGLRNMVLGADDKAIIDLKPSIEGAKIYYTTDGSAPSETSTLYSSPFAVDVKPGGSVELKTITVTPAGRKSYINAATLMRRDYLPAVNLPEKRMGVTYAFSAPDAKILVSGETRSLGPQQFAKVTDLKQPFSVGYDGYLYIDADGLYEFQIDSTWDCALSLNGEKLIDFTGAAASSIQKALVPLKAGFHKIALRYNNHGGNPRFRTRLGIAGQGLEGIDTEDLAH